MSKVSDEFFDSFNHDGGIVRTCDCGRTHFASWERGGWEEGELEGYQAKAEQDPDKYVDHTNDSITCAHIDGREFVYECKCDGMARYEKFIWAYREEILEYLTKRHKRQVEVLQAFNNKLQQHHDALAGARQIHVPELPA